MRRLLSLPLLAMAAFGAEPIVLSSPDIGDNYEEPPLLDAGDWLGLYIGDGESRLEPAQVRIASERDGEFTIYRITTEPSEAEMLLSGVPGVEPGPAFTAARALDLSPRRSQHTLDVRNRRYTVRLETSRPDQCDAVIVVEGEGRRQILFDAAAPAEFSCDEPHFEIIWAGDMDRDGRLDLLVTFSRKYSYYPRRLLLSSAAPEADIVGEAAGLERSSK